MSERNVGIKGSLYAIYDVKAHDLLGNQMGITVHKHEATAVRMFADAAAFPNSMIGKHPEDYALVRLGHMDDDHRIEEAYKVVLTGQQLMAAQPKE